ncbi:MAG: DUF4326 domain-containing protein [Actinomycetales bacterium]|uniref:DUF4326 domain-containing protein n=1 Tax=Candidatus Phosphoribacter hodrii TaxID=2953743 RepID=A0A935IYV2_9MICO|nr:DUF4326 domain-containing protein [Candidatus Phosphoribacter hodrii]
MSPQRIQRQRTKGWRMPEGAVYVGRPTKWGNPFGGLPRPCCEAWDVRDNNGVTDLTEVTGSYDGTQDDDRQG